MQKILPRGEIESFEHSSIPRVKLPVKASVFQDRANRLRQLASGHPLQAYLQLMASVIDVQHSELQTFVPPPLLQEEIDRAYTHSMPVLPITQPPVNHDWCKVLQKIIQACQAHLVELPNLATVIERLQAMSPQELDELASAILYDAVQAPEDYAVAPFVMAALQVYWVARAVTIQTKDLSPTSTFGVCPVCGGHPVSSIIHLGGAYQGYRYLHCGVCSTEWHVVRVTCTHCESTKGISYHYAEEKPAIKAEACDECKTYRKIFYTEFDHACEPIADDLASLEMDALIAEEGYLRVTGNPFLWMNRQAPS